MAKFNSAVKTGVQSPIKTTGKVIQNASGKDAFARDAKSELFLLAVSNFVGQDTFYESAKNRDDRFSALVRKVAVSDVNWTSKFINWLRNDAQMRSASVVAAAEAAKALLDAGVLNGSPRALVASSMARADEPGEFLAYWTSKYGKNLPQAVKKGVADAANRLYNEYSLLKYDTDSKGFRFADVLQLTHAKAKDAKQNALFSYALNRRYGSDVLESSHGNYANLPMIMARQAVNRIVAPVRKNMLTDAAALSLIKDAGMTWEALSGWLQGPMDKIAWEAAIPNMGYMALLRNLRNFQDAGVSAKVIKNVLNKLSDEEQVAKSRQFPFRFLSAYNATKGNLQIAAAMESALEASLSNVPSLKGRTLILVDRSGSMFPYGYGDSANIKSLGLSFADAAAIFGSAVALRAENATLVQFGTSSHEVSFRKGDSVLPMLSKFRDLGGTSTRQALQQHFRGHDRVIVITDEQYNGWGGDPTEVIPANVPVYTWNLNGYKAAQNESGKLKRHTFGGLTDKAWQMIPLLEASVTGVWPWDLVN